MKILIIDDIRSDFDIIPEMKAEGSNLLYKALEENVPRDDIVIARTYNMGEKLLCYTNWDVLYLDHDLGGEKTGYHIICFLEHMLNWDKNINIIPKQMICVSANPSGKKNIEEGWQAIQRKIQEIKNDPNYNKGYPE